MLLNQVSLHHRSNTHTKLQITAQLWQKKVDIFPLSESKWHEMYDKCDSFWRKRAPKTIILKNWSIFHIVHQSQRASLKWKSLASSSPPTKWTLPHSCLEAVVEAGEGVERGWRDITCGAPQGYCSLLTYCSQMTQSIRSIKRKTNTGDICQHLQDRQCKTFFPAA